MNTFQIKTSLLKTLKIRMTLPAQEAVAGQAISVALGQHGVKTNDFIKNFNEVTKSFPKGLKIVSDIFVQKDGSFRIDIKGVSGIFLLNSFVEDNQITVSDLYLIALCLKKSRLDFQNLGIHSIFKTLLGTLFNNNKNIKILF